MKSIFTKLGTLLLCGAVAMVSCTDFSEDIQNLDNKVDNLGNTTQTELATLQKAITDLEAKLSAQYATKEYVDGLNATLKTDLEGKIAGLSEDIAAVSDALKTAKGEINEAIAGLDDKKADKTAVDAAVKTATDAIAALKADLEAAKGDLEAEIESVKAEIADAQEQLNSKIDGVDAKAEELHNTILALGDYLKTLEARVNELKGTLDALSEYLPTIEAKVAELKGTLDALSDHLEGREAEVDAKLNELHNTLLALSDHLAEYEATTDFKLVELQGSLAALSVYLEEYEASVDAKFKEILNTFDSLDGFLDEKFADLDEKLADLEATDTDLYKEIEGIRVVLTALNNLLTDETAERMAEDNALYELIGTSVTALNNLIADLEAEDTAIYAEIDGVRQAFTTLNNLLNDEVADRTAEDAAIYELIGTSVTALNNLIADLAAQDDAIYVEMENIRTYIAQVYNSLSYEIQAVDAALKAHIAAFEAFKEAYEAKVDELEATDTDLYLEIDGLREVITTINNHIEDLKAEDTAIYLEIDGLRENLTQLQNAINNRIDDEVAALEADILDRFNILNTVILETEKRVNDKFNHTLKLIAENSALITANAAAIADLKAAVEMLMGWVAGQEENNELQAELIAKVYEIVGEIEEQIEALTQKDNELEGLIGKTAGALQTYMDENNERLAELETYTKENVDLLGKGIGNLEAIINDLEARFGARLDALEERVDNIEIDVDALKAALEALDTALAEAEKRLDGKDEALEEMIHNIDKAIEDLKDDMWANRKDIAKNSEQIAAIFTSISKIQSELADNAEWQANMTTVTNQLNDAIAALWEAIDLLGTTLQKNIDEAVANLTAEDTKIRAEIEAGLAEMLRLAINNDSGVMDNVRQFEIKMSGIVEELRAAIKNLANRVQSLVYVPEYADHKATIEYAVISPLEMIENDRPAEAIANREDGKQLPYTYVVKASDLKYLVKAENAADVAQEIANNWASVLDYEVKDVKTRGASESGADLEIVNVKAEGEYIIVSVVAKNFDAKFFEKKRMGGIYSAALVLSDENNTRTTEYTNLVPGRPAEFQMSLFLPVEDPEYVGESNMRYVADGEVITYLMPCNDTKTVKSAVKPIVGFIPAVDGQPNITNPVSFFTTELMVEEGYDVEVAKKAVIVCYDGTHEREFYDNPNPDKNEGIETGKYFNIGEGPKWDYHYTVKEGTSFDSVGENSTVTYEYTCGNTTATLTYDFVLANAQVAINIVKDIKWTVALQGDLYVDGKGHYQKPLVFEIEDFEAVGGPVISLASALKQEKKSTDSYVMVDGEWVESSKNIANKSFTEVGGIYQLQAGTYSWNNSYKVVFVTTNSDEHVDYTTTMIVNLVGRPDEINVPVKVEYVLNGGESYFKADADLFGASFKAMEKYLGYADAAADTAQWKKIFTNNLVKSLMAEGNTNLPLVNGKAGRASSLYNLEQARLSIIDHNNGRYTILEGEPNVTTWSGTPWFGIPVNFTVTGSLAALPYDLIYSEDYVTNGVATVYGQIENGEYTILKSDLAKYFNVDAKSLDGHDFTVEFTVNAPKATETESVIVADKNGNANLVTNVVERTIETYNYLERDKVVLDWNTYKGLEVEVTAVLKMNGFERESLDLTLVTKDPLTLTGADFTVERQLRNDRTIQVFQSLVLTSSVEPNKENLLQFKNSNGTVYNWQEAIAYAEGVYGAEAEFVLGPKGLYHYNNSGKEIILGANKYNFDATTGMITIYGDDAQVKNYYADFTVVFKSRICGGEHRVPVRITFTLK